MGTGHIPIAPIGFFLSGAASVITVDLHRRIDWSLTRGSLEWIASHRLEVEKLYADIVPKRVFDERFAVLIQLKNTPQRFLEEAGIEYLAPMDAAHIRLPAKSIDCHFSNTVLEHIPPVVLADIFTESKRLLKPSGVAIHFIDCSDHFQHQDKSISSVNFLRYSKNEWDSIAGNEFAYCNRLRASDYKNILSDLKFEFVRFETSVDTAALKRGCVLHNDYLHYDPEDICATSVRVMARFSDSGYA